MILTPKQQLFVAEYLVDLNATQAAVRAGYSKKTAYSVGHENLKKPEVAAAIQEAMAARSERTKADQDWIVERLVENVERAMQLEPVTDREGKPVGEHVYQGNVANKALELLGKHLGMFTDKLKLEGDFLDDLSADDLAVLARHLREAGYGAPGEGEPETRH